jgi:hypothetical protein
MCERLCNQFSPAWGVSKDVFIFISILLSHLQNLQKSKQGQFLIWGTKLVEPIKKLDIPRRLRRLLV